MEKKKKCSSEKKKKKREEEEERESGSGSGSVLNRLRGALNTKEVSVSFRFVSFRILIEMRMLSSRLNALNSLLYSSPSRLHSSSSSASASTSSRREERRSSSSCVLRGDREGANASTSRRSRRSLSLRTAKGNVEMQQHSSQEKHTSFGVVRQ